MKGNIMPDHNSRETIATHRNDVAVRLNDIANLLLTGDLNAHRLELLSTALTDCGKIVHILSTIEARISQE
jgi:hypothetical protein